MSSTTIPNRPTDRKLGELRRAISQRPDVQAACKRAPQGILNAVLGGFTRAIRDNPSLASSDNQSILDSLFDAIDLGMVPGREGYFIQYGNRCRFQAGYKGILRLVTEAGVKKVDVREVRAGDQFSVELGDDERIVHRVSIASDREKEPITHVYAVALLESGERKREIWSRERIDRHKEQFSEAWKRAEKKSKDSPWHTSWLAMASKTVLLALCKLLPQTPALARVEAVERKAEGDEILDASFAVAPTAPALSPAQSIPSQTSQEDAGEDTAPSLSEDAITRLRNLELALENCDAILQCDEAAKPVLQAAADAHEKAALMAVLDARKTAIRTKRGSRSNK